jgi:ABC-2 type transport system ATP-binding protein
MIKEAGLASHLVVENLSKKYDSFVALKPTSFDLKGGEITILSGPNGSGKTTLLSCLAGLVPPSKGSVSVMGYDLYRNEVEVRRRMVYVPDVPRFYLELTAWEHLRFIAMANGVEEGFEGKAEDILKKFGIWEEKDLFPHHYSRGMRLKLGLSLALVRPFDVILLDEPTSALDEESVKVLINTLKDIRDKGAAILLTSHDPGLIDLLADRRMLMEHGEIKVAA